MVYEIDPPLNLASRDITCIELNRQYKPTILSLYDHQIIAVAIHPTEGVSERLLTGNLNLNLNKYNKYVKQPFCVNSMVDIFSNFFPIRV